ncbi:alkaline phosphatase family protein [Candidatus Altiarchaeota archaeon]
MAIFVFVLGCMGGNTETSPAKTDDAIPVTSVTQPDMIAIDDAGTTLPATNKTASTLPATDVQVGSKTAKKLHWFIPDGMRADPSLFNIFKWAEEGKLPNIKKLMDNGVYGYSIPTFPSHTPTNFATLLTGTYPKYHGVADGPMHVEGRPLLKPSVGGFSSVARKAPAIWSLLEDSGKKVVLLSMPGSTPPELKYGGITIRGRWGGWGADYHSLIFEKNDSDQRKKLARGSRLFFLGYELTRFIEPDPGSDWPLTLSGHGAVLHARIAGDSIEFSKDGENVVASLGEGDWSDWIPVNFTWKDKTISSNVKVSVIRLDDDGFFRIRFLVDNLNQFIVYPGSVSNELKTEAGPMVDFVDNFPPQLIYYPEDKKAFLAERDLSFEWHKGAVDSVYDLYSPDVFIHDIYSPNQQLTSRWWLGYVDPTSKRYDHVNDTEREVLWAEVMDLYTHLDEVVGKAMANADEDTVIVLSSDHGATPLDRWIRLNNFFAEKGWLKYSIKPDTGEPVIDFANTKVLYLKMDNVYIHPDGLAGNWTRASGQEYEALRDEVITALDGLKHPTDEDKPIIGIVKWEDVEEFLDLPSDRVGDLVVANFPGFGFNEEITSDGQIFDDAPLKTGYKQAIFANDTKAMWTPFIISGPGVRKGVKLKEPISMVDQFPTIMTVLGQEVPDYVQGKVLTEVVA